MWDFQLVWDYDEFVDCYFLQGDDDADSLREAEHEQLRLFYTMYAELSDESAGFDKALAVWCATDEAYLACTGDEEACARRDAIKNNALSHLSQGLARCGQDRANVREANSLDETLSEYCGVIEETLDKVMEIRGQVDELAAAFSRRCCMNTPWGRGRASWAGCGPDVKRDGHPEIDADHGVFGR